MERLFCLEFLPNPVAWQFAAILTQRKILHQPKTEKMTMPIAYEKPDVPRVATMVIFPLAWSVVEYKIRS